jgi:hypothetical protein
VRRTARTSYGEGVSLKVETSLMSGDGVEQIEIGQKELVKSIWESSREA